jgi:hypothetical protein
MNIYMKSIIHLHYILNNELFRHCILHDNSYYLRTNKGNNNSLMMIVLILFATDVESALHFVANITPLVSSYFQKRSAT